jgi:ribonuclease HI
MTNALDTTGMKFSAQKTQVIIFSKKEVDTNTLTKLKMYGNDIEYVEETKYLGVIFDSKLNFRAHINNKFNKAKRLLFGAKNAMGKFWGPSPTLTKWLYTNIVRPTFTYGCIAWAKATRTKLFAKKAKRLQRLGLKNLGPIRTHSPTSGLEIATYTPPLEIFIQGEFISAYTRIKTFVNPDNTNKTRDTLASHIAWAEKLSENAGISNIPTDITTPFFHWLHKWKITLENYNTYNEARPNKLQIFTDGSHIKQPDKTGVTGCGYAIVQFDTEKNDYFPSHVESIYLGKMATIFQAEVHAIWHACTYINNNINKYITQGIEAIDVISDSRSSLQALQRNCTTSNNIKNCKITLDTLHTKIPIRLHWIKAHQGHAGNELADLRAKHGTTLVNTLVEPIIPVSHSWIKNKITQFVHTEWADKWQKLPEARQTKIFFPQPHKQKAKKLMTYNREHFAELFRWISGHSFHRYHNSLTNPENFPDPTCRACGIDREETGHLFAECPALSQTRYKILGHHILPLDFQWTPSNLQAMVNAITERYPEEIPRAQGNNFSQPREPETP